MTKRKHFGNAGHFIGSDSCRFHICTQIGKIVISTVGEYRPRLKIDEGKDFWDDIGSNRKFETMVFKSSGLCSCGCGMPEIIPSEIDMVGYQTRVEANLGHEKMCVKWEKKLARKTAKP